MKITELKNIIADLYLLNEHDIAQLEDTALDKILRAIASEKTVDAPSLEKIITLISPENIGLSNHEMAKLAYRTATESLPIAYKRNLKLERPGLPINYSFKQSEPLYKITQYFTRPHSLEELLRVSYDRQQPYPLYVDHVAGTAYNNGIFHSQDRDQMVGSGKIVYFVANLHNFMHQKMEGLSMKQAFFGALIHPSFNSTRKDGLTYLQVISQLEGFSFERIDLLNRAYQHYIADNPSRDGRHDIDWHEKLALIFNNFDAFLNQINSLNFTTLCHLLMTKNHELRDYIEKYNQLPLSERLQVPRLPNLPYSDWPPLVKNEEAISASFLLQVFAHPATRVAATIFLIAGIAGLLVCGTLGLAGTSLLASGVVTTIAASVTVAGFFAAKNIGNDPMLLSNPMATSAL